MSDRIFYALSGLSAVGVVAIIVWLVGASANHACMVRWPDRNPSWAWFQGCVIDTSEGRIPAQNYRVL